MCFELILHQHTLVELSFLEHAGELRIIALKEEESYNTPKHPWVFCNQLRLCYLNIAGPKLW